MRVREIMEALVGVPGDLEIEIVDADGIAAELLKITVTSSYGSLYGEALIDRKLIADDETVVKDAA